MLRIGVNFIARLQLVLHNEIIEFSMLKPPISNLQSPRKDSMILYNTIVISDLHLGEDLGPTATEATRQHISHVDTDV